MTVYTRASCGGKTSISGVCGLRSQASGWAKNTFAHWTISPPPLEIKIIHSWYQYPDGAQRRELHSFEGEHSFSSPTHWRSPAGCCQSPLHCYSASPMGRGTCTPQALPSSPDQKSSPFYVTDRKYGVGLAICTSHLLDYTHRTGNLNGTFFI